MHCPVCRGQVTRVIDSRLSSDNMLVRRRRECDACQYRFSTKEEMELLDIVVVKNDGHRESYVRDKLCAGILHSLSKRPYTSDCFDQLIYAIERDIRKKKKKEITSRDIGDIVMKHLAKFDTVAYIRFASIYRAFEDVNKFETEIQSLNKPYDQKIKKTRIRPRR